ncbi:Thymidylate synthase [Naganishia vaughanmartiniae]|uniref:Thymidylate synthase n=1 Tax=Naganishia vaughanmartiniae TaxID=1424756 RepID=A0ACC2XBY6_9TREE|nr:Thymidylate synthase [Naganishia vaughanmartiniae]
MVHELNPQPVASPGTTTTTTTTTTIQPKRHEEYQYLDLIRHVINHGQHRPDRTGTGTIAIFAPPSLRFSLANGALPLLTTKRVFLRGVIEELLWFVRGSTDGKLLAAKDVNIWAGNGSREYLDKVGLGHRREGDLGPVYGFQWRHFGAEYKTCEDDYTGQGVDQLAQVIDKIRNNPTDRRIIMSAWNPKDLPSMALPPCHMFCQFYVTLPPAPTPTNPTPKPLLSCLMYQRSCDLGLGVPFNIASYALLTHMIALMTDTEPHEFILQMGDAHVYADHVEPLMVQLEREPREFPRLEWNRGKDEVGDIDGFRYEDFGVVGYKPMGKIEMKMSA